MKKRIISLAIAVMFGCSIYTSAITTYAEEACGETDTVSKGTLLYETEVITQKDYDEGFQNYALSAATVDLAVSMHTFSNNNLANVVGVVRDQIFKFSQTAFRRFGDYALLDCLYDIILCFYRLGAFLFNNFQSRVVCGFFFMYVVYALRNLLDIVHAR